MGNTVADAGNLNNLLFAALFHIAEHSVCRFLDFAQKHLVAAVAALGCRGSDKHLRSLYNKLIAAQTVFGLVFLGYIAVIRQAEKNLIFLRGKGFVAAGQLYIKGFFDIRGEILCKLFIAAGVRGILVDNRKFRNVYSVYNRNLGNYCLRGFVVAFLGAFCRVFLAARGKRNKHKRAKQYTQ